VNPRGHGITRHSWTRGVGRDQPSFANRHALVGSLVVRIDLGYLNRCGLLIDIGLRHFKIAPDLNLFLIASATITMMVVASVAIWGIWPLRTDESQFARFHIVGTEVAFSSQNPNQLIANIFF
jgi:hypothetical protein